MLAHQLLNTTGTLLQIYQVPNGNTAGVNVRICNQNASNVKVSLVISDVSSPDSSYTILNNYTIYPNDIYTEAGLVLNAGDYIFVKTDTSDVSVVVYGWVQPS